MNDIPLMITIGGIVWAYFRFRKESPLHPRIEFDLDCKFFSPQQDSVLTAITISANNKGNIEHKFSEIRIRILGIAHDQPLKVFEKYPPMTDFPIELVKGANIVPSEYGYFFVRPSINQTFNYTVLIPTHIRFVLVRASFKYERGNLYRKYRETKSYLYKITRAVKPLSKFPISSPNYTDDIHTSERVFEVKS